MKGGILAVFVLLVLVFSLISGFSKEENIKINDEVFEKFDSGEEKVKVIIDLKDSFHIDEKKEIIKKIDGKNKSVKFASGSFAVEISKKELNDLIIEDKVDYVEPVRYFNAFLTESANVINASSTWGLQAYDINLTGINQTICIIDTGIDYTHPDLSGRNVTGCNLDCVNNEAAGCFENCSETDLNGHGTHVAGIAAASGNLFGIAKGVNFVGLKVFPGSGTSGATTTGITNAIDWCVNNASTYNISVISMSLGTSILYSNNCDLDFAASFNVSIMNAFYKNISVVVATGNDANTTAISSPACISNAIPVADTYDSNIGPISWIGTCDDATTAIDQIVCHANRNSLVKLFAPGALINSTWVDGTYSNQGGTSMAAPMVSGAVAIINQLLALTSQTKTPAEIETTLYNSGKRITDNGNNFSRIDIYNASLSLDNITPNITLISPIDNHLNLTQNQSFLCNATDWQLANITFYLWNSTGNLIYNETQNVSGTFNQASFNATNLNYEYYRWACGSSDLLGNSFIATNFTLIIGGIKTTLNSPQDNNYTNQNYTNFTCRSQSEADYILENVTFYLWNSTSDVIYNETKNISGFDNSSIFNFTFFREENYVWNCLSYNNNSNLSWDSNFSITYDITAPIVNLSSVEDGASTTRNFEFNVSDINSISSCSVYVDGTPHSNTSAINKSAVNTITVSGLSVASHSAYVNCTDVAGNTRNSSIIRFIVSSAPDTGSPGSGGGGASISSFETFTPTIEEISQGYSKEMKKNDKIKFEIFDEKTKQHSITLEYVGENFVNITIQSEPIKIILGVGQSIKLNLTSADYYNLYIKLDAIENKKAKLTIQTIHDLIVKKIVEVEQNKTDEGKKSDGQEDSGGNPNGYFSAYIIAGYIVIVLVIVFLIWIIHSLRIKIIKIKRKRKNLKAKESKQKHGKNKK